MFLNDVDLKNGKIKASGINWTKQENFPIQQKKSAKHPAKQAQQKLFQKLLQNPRTLT